MRVGEWEIDIVSGGSFLHDGGILYGVVPKSIWQTVTPADAQNLVPLTTNCLLARSVHGNLLIDTGHGDKLSPLDRKAHGVEPGWPLPEDLARLGLAPTDIRAVILSHLHWDHAGGATSRTKENVVATFPSATYYVHRQEWADATSGCVELSGGYSGSDYLPLMDEGRLVLIDHLAEIMPGVRVFQTGGHTQGHVAVAIESQGEGILYLGDVAPTAAHLRRMWCTAYDLNLSQTRKVKAELFGYAADRGLWVVWNHDPQIPVSKIVRHEKREFILSEAVPLRSPEFLRPQSQ
ncbi:MAG: MBL fold metallo-hydrolase [Pirellulaceae bacterium]